MPRPILADHSHVALFNSASVLSQLPGRAAAEQHLSEIWRQNGPGYITVVVARDVHWMNEYRGYDAGDEVLDELARVLTLPVGGARQVFRWTATSFLLSADLPLDGEPAPDAESGTFRVRAARSPKRLFECIDFYVASRLVERDRVSAATF